MSYHEPVLLHESVEGLNIKPDGIYVDVTFGGGGHSREILKQLANGRLFGFDQDADAEKNIQPNENFTFVAQNFRHLQKFLRFYGVKQIDGLLADLGVSSHQLNEATRGFTFREDAPLDMRMNQNVDKSAADVVNTYEAADLANIFRLYGELTQAGRLASAICDARQMKAIATTYQLKAVVQPFIPQKQWHKFMAQLFQALRIEVNDEMGALRDLLEQCVQVLKPGGRLVVISYHSLEDRLVKNFIRDGKFSGEADKDFFGNKMVPFEPVTRKPITPTKEELETNNRARSAKLRIAKRTDFISK